MKLSLLVINYLLYTQFAFSNAHGVQGVYKSIFYHEASKTSYYSEINLFTENPDGEGVKFSADVTFYFSEANSAESIRLKYENIDYDVFTGEFTLESEASPLKMKFFIEKNTLTGTWFLRKTGALGTIKASTEKYPDIEEGFTNLSSLGGEFRGEFIKTNDQSRLPTQLSFSFLVSQDNSNPNNPTPKISGFAKFYIGNYGSQEYIKIRFNPISYNFYDRTLALVAKIRHRTFTISASVSPTGEITGVLSETSIGELGNIHLTKYHSDIDKVFMDIDEKAAPMSSQRDILKLLF